MYNGFMKMKLSKSKRGNNWEILLTIPVTQKENNCYVEDIDLSDVNNICGIIDDNNFGFCKVINMAYCGKSDQYTSTFLDCGMFMDKKEDFEKLCEKIGMDIVYYHSNKYK